MARFEIVLGDVLEQLRTLPAASVQCCATSPPYWGLRSYNVEPNVWGGNPECDHQWGDTIQVNATNHTDKRRWQHTRNGREEGQPTEKRVAWLRTVVPQGQFCQVCGAWAGCLGLEPTPKLFVSNMVEVFDEVWRVLRDDGVLWLNLGDTYATGAGAACSPGGGKQGENFAGPKGYRGTRGDYPKHKMPQTPDKKNPNAAVPTFQPNLMPIDGMKPKDLVGIPWMTAFALRDAGWYLRSAPPWVKRNPMPESCEDRPGTSHEYCFLLTKSERYYYDFCGVRAVDKGKWAGNGFNHQPESLSVHCRGSDQEWTPGSGRNRRTADWFFESLQSILDGGQGLLHDECGNPAAFVVNLRPFKGSHFAVWPEALVRPMIQAATSERGACTRCKTPWERVVAKKRVATRPGENTKVTTHKQLVESNADAVGWNHGNAIGNRDPQRHQTEMLTVGWYPGCQCDNLSMLLKYPTRTKEEADTAEWEDACETITEQRRVMCLHAEAIPTEPCVVLDPFSGAGTTLKVAVEMGRHGLGIELNPEYRAMAIERVQKVVDGAPLFFSEGA